MYELLSEIEHPVLLAVVLVACAPVYGLWAWPLFGSAANVARAFRWVFTRDSKSFAAGDYVEDKFAEWRLAALAALCIGELTSVAPGVVWPGAREMQSPFAFWSPQPAISSPWTVAAWTNPNFVPVSTF